MKGNLTVIVEKKKSPGRQKAKNRYQRNKGGRSEMTKEYDERLLY